MGYKNIILLLIILFVSGCKVIETVPHPKTEIVPDKPEIVATTLPAVSLAPTSPPTTATPVPTITPTIGPSPTPTSTPFFLQSLSTKRLEKHLPRHGIWITIILPLLCIVPPWLVAEYFVVRYVQPKSADLTSILIRAQDGLFIQATLSMTARRSLSIASTQMSWERMQSFVEKTLEQELIQQSLQYQTLRDLESNLKTITDSFLTLPIVKELWMDFGVEVIRFNISPRYPTETSEALNRMAEAAAGGSAFLSYAAAAKLNPASPEGRELYRVYQETRSQVDAARNLGNGIGNLASLLGQKTEGENSEK